MPSSLGQMLPSMTSHMAPTPELRDPGNAGTLVAAHSSLSNTRRGVLSPSGHTESAGERDQRAPASSSASKAPSTPGSTLTAGSGSMVSNDRLFMLRPLGTHTGHPHSGHTHGHPGSSNPHPPHEYSHILNVAPSGPGHGHGEGSSRGGSGSGSYVSSSGGAGASGSRGGHLPHQSMGTAVSSSARSTNSGLMSSGILIGPGGHRGLTHGAGGGIGHGHGAVVGEQTMLEMEMWPRRRVVYHVAEWLEWLGCEDALVRDHSAFPAWTIVL